MKFLDVFKAIIPNAEFVAADIENVVMKRGENYLSADIVLPFPISEAVQQAFSDEVRAVYGIENIDFSFKFPAPEPIVVEAPPTPKAALSGHQAEKKSRKLI